MGGADADDAVAITGEPIVTEPDQQAVIGEADHQSAVATVIQNVVNDVVTPPAAPWEIHEVTAQVTSPEESQRSQPATVFETLIAPASFLTENTVDASQFRSSELTESVTPKGFTELVPEPVSAPIEHPNQSPVTVQDEVSVTSQGIQGEVSPEFLIQQEQQPAAPPSDETAPAVSPREEAEPQIKSVPHLALQTREMAGSASDVQGAPVPPSEPPVVVISEHFERAPKALPSEPASQATRDALPLDDNLATAAFDVLEEPRTASEARPIAPGTEVTVNDPESTATPPAAPPEASVQRDRKPISQGTEPAVASVTGSHVEVPLVESETAPLVSAPAVAATDFEAKLATGTVNVEVGEVTPRALQASPNGELPEPAQTVKPPDSASTATVARDLPDHAASALRAAAMFDRPIRIRLTPPELGALLVEVSRHEGAVTARFEVTTPAAHSTLSDHLSTLRESLSRMGVSVDRIELRLAESKQEESQPRQREGSDQQNQQHHQSRQEQRRDPLPHGRPEIDESSEESGRNSSANPEPTANGGGSVSEALVASDVIDIQV